LSLFVDTSAWYAAADRGDRRNARAKRILSADEPLVTTDHVLVETWFLLTHRLGQNAGDRFWGRLRAGVATVEPVTDADLESAWTIGTLFEDQGFSIVDRTSFAVMQRLGIHRAASFDSDFSVYRFGPGKRHAFTVLD
jgi:predicted nucleic acid-binding protein